MRVRASIPTLCACVATLLTTTFVIAAEKSGVAPSKINLPDGPGALTGVGENVEPNISMGLMTHRVPIPVPEGYPGVTPEISLVYNSGTGSSEVGLGWSLPLPSIERMTAYGLPRYTSGDRFAANGSDELVPIPDSNGRYRARFEKAFVRYTFRQVEGGEYWAAEHPDGTVSYFGATAHGELITSATDPGADGGVFRYRIVETVDVFGHALRYEYERDGTTSRIARIEYVFSGDESDYQVLFSYGRDGPRPDPTSDAKSGVVLGHSECLSGIQVLARGEQLRRYELTYEDAAISGGLSRLARVRWFGLDDEGPFPIEFSFDYSAGLAFSAPRRVDMGGSLGVDLADGTADLIDLNSDALPDVVETGGARHLIFLNELASNDTQRFAAAVESEVGALALQSPSSEMFDLDGDGRTDFVDSLAGQVLWNRGEGDWDAEEPAAGFNLPNLGEDANLRFFDWDDDKSIDLLHVDSSGTFVYVNLGDGRFEATAVEADPIDASFVEDNLELADMNGDGLSDVVRKATDLVSYRLHLGYGRFSDWIELENPPANLVGDEQLVDVNGDAQADLVAVRADDVVYALNRNGRAFGDVVSLAETSEVEIPERTSEISVRFADMNASGSTDVVYVTSSGAVSYLELFPERPNLLTRIDNGIGKVIEVAYGSSAAHMQRDGGAGAWEHRLPHVMLTVDEIVVRDELSGVEQRRSFRYSNGFYDGVEKQFRGFTDVVVETQGDATVEAGVVRHRFDVGFDDPYWKGLLLAQETESGGEATGSVSHDYADCDVGGAGGAPRVRFVCSSGTTWIVKERRSESEWVTIREEFSYDSYGNVTENAKLGVISIGGEGCECERAAGVFGAPCGEGCSGDERFESTTFVPPSRTGGRWILNKPWRKYTRGASGGAVAEEVFHYDGVAFEGIEGELELGLLSRVSARVDESTFIDRERFAYDDAGAVTDALDANGRRRSFEYDPTSLRVESETLHLDDPELRDEGYSLRMSAAYHPVLDTVVRASAWQRVAGDGDVVSPERATEFAWDAFGRIAKTARPGDTLDAPTEEYAYEIRPRVSRIVQRTRSRAGEEPDLEEIQCFDGLGREIQKRTRIEGDRYQASGFSEWNLAGQLVRAYQPYTASSGRCSEEPPDGVLATTTRYDATGRPLSVEQPDDALYGEPSLTATTYLPLRTEVSDPEDGDPASPHFGTPTATVVDGLGRTVRHERVLFEDQDGERVRRVVPIELTYDELSRLRGYVDVNRNEKVQEYDLLGRVMRIVDPDSGETTRTYDPAGNLLTETDARGITTHTSYDEANRVLSQWEGEREAETFIEYTYDSLEGIPEDCDDCTNLEGELARVAFPMDDDGATQGIDLAGYDERGQPTYTRRTLDGHEFELRTEFDNAGRIVARSYPTGHRIESVLDAAGRLTRVPGYVENVSYEARGLLGTVAFANGVQTEHRYDPVARLSHLETAGPSGTIQAYRYTRDRVGNIGEITDDSAVGDAPSANGRFTYDAWYRLTLSELDRDREAEETLTTAYDVLDNITLKTSSVAGSPDHVGAYTYDGDIAGPHAVTQAGDIALRYDAAGNMTRQGDDEYAWDYLGRLRYAERGDTILGSYTYGADRTRVRKVEDGHTTYYVAPDFEVRDGTAFIYVTLGDRKVVKLEIPEYASDFLADLAPGTLDGQAFSPEPDDTVTAADAWIAQALTAGLYTTDADVEVSDALVDELLAASTRRMLGIGEERVTFLHHNHLGTTVATTDADGAVLQRAEHYPYGEVRWQSEGWGEEYGYTGKERDGTGLGYFGGRLYAARLGAWISGDPLMEIYSQSTKQPTPFAALAGNPLRYSDPDGYAAVDEARSGIVRDESGATLISRRLIVQHIAQTGRDCIATAERMAGVQMNKRIQVASPNSYDSRGQVISTPAVAKRSMDAFWFAKKEIDAGRPVVAGLSYTTQNANPDGTDHGVAVTGYSIFRDARGRTQFTLHYDDPGTRDVVRATNRDLVNVDGVFRVAERGPDWVVDAELSLTMVKGQGGQ